MLNAHKPQFNTIIEQFSTEISKLRTSRATPSLIEDISIEVYGGSRMKLNELASISSPDPRMLVIKPWDKSIIKNIEKGLVKSDLEFNPVVETEILRIQLPLLTQETREKLVKKLNEILENHRIKLRKLRDEIKKDIETKQKAGEITKDDRYSLIENLNKMVKDSTEDMEQMGKKKQEEIMTI